MTETKLGLLRHGQTDWNIDFRLQGITDIPLNETGLAQANAAAKVIDASMWDLVISSPLSRAIATAKIVAELNGFVEPQLEPLLLERSFGEAEGLGYQEWRLQYPDTNQVPGGESLIELEARAKRLLEIIIQKYSGQRIIAVSHGALIRKLLRIVSQGELPRDGERLANASMNIFLHDDSGWRIKTYEPRTLHSDLI